MKPNAGSVSIEAYLAKLPEEKRRALGQIRAFIRAEVPDAEECVSYGLPAFRWKGKPLAAFGASAKHCSFHPMSGQIVGRMKADLADFNVSKGTIRFHPGMPLPPELLTKLLKARMEEIQR